MPPLKGVRTPPPMEEWLVPELKPEMFKPSGPYFHTLGAKNLSKSDEVRSKGHGDQVKGFIANQRCDNLNIKQIIIEKILSEFIRSIGFNNS